MRENLPRTVDDGITRWRVTIDRPDHFRAVRRLDLTHASADERALLGCGGIVWLAALLTLIGTLKWLLEPLLRLMNGNHGVHIREMLVAFGLFIGAAALLWTLFPKFIVLEARPGVLRFGHRRWDAAQVSQIETSRRIILRDISWEIYPFSGPPKATWHVLDVVLVLKDGRRQRVWGYVGRHKSRVEDWMAQMAVVAGVPFIQE